MYVCVCIGNIIDTLNFYVIYVVYAYVCVCMCTLCMCVHVYICMCVHDQVHVPQLLELCLARKKANTHPMQNHSKAASRFYCQNNDVATKQ